MRFEEYPCACAVCRSFPDLKPEQWLDFLLHKESVAILLKSHVGVDLFVCGRNDGVRVTSRASTNAKSLEELGVNYADLEEYIRSCEVRPRDIYETPFVHSLTMPSVRRNCVPQDVRVLPK